MISRARITYKQRESFTKCFPQPFTYMTMREKFDGFLTERAVSAGASLMDGFKVNRIDVDNGVSQVFGEKDAFDGKVLVGADGANSIVAHRLGLLQEAEMGVGLESEVYTEDEYLQPWASIVSLDFGTIRGGYMWVFPKGDHLSIGVAGFMKFGPRMRDLLDGYLSSLQIGDFRLQVTRRHRLARRRLGMPFHIGNAVLIGYAAGTVDFWTGEGIYYALRTAQMAAPAVCNYLEGNVRDLRQYEEVVDR
ncbi:MAG: NAD(P)/FAD-dependent oxidoreductase [Dehalococcoidia bacterium]|nr:NAD(P)/FAD-dependent oxidoreductase [Dehalococcoidia bacterium]